MPYPPRLALSDSDVMVRSFNTRKNPNLMRNEESAVGAIRDQNSQMADEVSRVMKKNRQQKNIHKIDKKKKDRQHSWLSIIWLILLI